MENNCKPKEQMEKLLSEFSAPSYDQWREEAEKSLKGKPLDKLVTKTYENIDVKPLYRKEDLVGLPHLENQIPGEFPFVRSAKPQGYRGGAWQIVSEYKYPTPEENNEAIKLDLKHCPSAIRIHPDKASILGENPQTADVDLFGTYGTNIASVADFDTMLAGVDITKTPIHIYTGRRAMTFAAMFRAYLEKNGIAADQVSGAIEFDPFGVFEKCGHLPSDEKVALDEMFHLLKWGEKNLKNFTTIEILASNYRDAGSSAVEELGFAFARAVFYIKEMIARGAEIDEVAQKIRFSLGIGQTFFMEIAKFRAARMVWAKIIKEFGGNADSQKLKINAVTEMSNITRLDAQVNFLRTSSESISAIIGGTDSLRVAHYTDGFGLPDDFARRIAKNTQIVLRDECNLTDVIDPAAGSYFVEALTAEIAQKVWTLFTDVEARGGYLSAIKEGFIQSTVKATAAAKVKALASRKDVLVGSNKYSNLTEKAPNFVAFCTKDVAAKRRQAIKDFVGKRDEAKAQAALGELAKSAKADTRDVFERATVAYLAGATIAEVEASAVYITEKTPIAPVEPVAKALAFEQLRAKADEYRNKNGELPKVFLSNMGTVAQFKGRQDFSMDFMKVAGFECIENLGFPTPAEAAKAFAESGAKATVICSTDDNYELVVPELAGLIKKASPSAKIILAGYPTEKIDEYKAAGVDEFIHVKANVVEVLSRLQSDMKIA